MLVDQQEVSGQTPARVLLLRLLRIKFDFQGGDHNRGWKLFDMSPSPTAGLSLLDENHLRRSTRGTWLRE